MQYSLWGNKTDLSMLVDASNVDPASLISTTPSGTPTPYLIVDDFPGVWAHLSAPPPTPSTPRRIDIVLDNAGLELLGDMCLADFLTASGLADSVVFHGKRLPWFVSDVMEADFEEMLQLCGASADADLRWLGERWRGYIRDGR